LRYISFNPEDSKFELSGYPARPPNRLLDGSTYPDVWPFESRRPVLFDKLGFAEQRGQATLPNLRQRFK
jgi:hypothetical protein